jgi:uncharacterized protein (TIGR03067 family)
MKVTALLALTVGLLAAGLGAKDDPVKKDIRKFQGTWKVVSVEMDGKKQTDEKLKSATMTVEGNKYTVEAGGKTVEQGTFKIDPTKSPKTIDVTATQGKGKGNTYHGIYEIKGDTVRDCFARDGKDRPTDFKTKAGSAWVLRTYKRQKS